MTDSPSPSTLAPFAWVTKRDGRQVPFDPDKISRSLFAATERLGSPDAFLARELADSVLHFLAAEADGHVPTTADIADLVVKVVRELGHPALAQAFAGYDRATPPSAPEPPSTPALSLEQLGTLVEACPPPVPLAWGVASTGLRTYSLREVFTRDLLAAQNDGLISLTGLETPLELGGHALAGGVTLLDDLEAARGVTGGILALDSPEYALAGRPAADLTDYARAVGFGSRTLGLHIILNLNSAVAPVWTHALAEGPLFAGRQRLPEGESLARTADALLEVLAAPRPAGDGVRIDWHLGKADFSPGAAPRLQRVVRAAVEGTPLALVFDRPRHPVALAEGLDRENPAVLLTVALHLPRLMDAGTDPSRFLQKLGSLARVALSAARQKREFLRRHAVKRPALSRAFLLERARLVVNPLGLEEAVQALGGGAELAQQIVQRLRDVLYEDGRTYQLSTCVEQEAVTAVESGDGESVASPVKPWLQRVGTRHAVTGTGTATLVLPAEWPPTVQDLGKWLRYAWQHTDLVRLRLARG